MLLSFDWAAWSAVVSAVAAVLATLVAIRASRDNRNVLETNREMAQANRKLVEIEASRRDEEISARAEAAAELRRANLSLELIDADRAMLRGYRLRLHNAGPANAHDVTVVPTAFTGYHPPDLPVPGIEGRVHPVNLHAGETMMLNLADQYLPGALPGLECTVRWRDDGDAHHEKRLRANAPVEQ